MPTSEQKLVVEVTTKALFEKAVGETLTDEQWAFVSKDIEQELQTSLDEVFEREVENWIADK